MKSKSNKTITVISDSLLVPIVDLLQLLFKRSRGGVNDVQTSLMENGYSVSICLLLIAHFESLMMRELYFHKNIKAKNGLQLLNLLYPNFPKSKELEECYVLRDCIIHNHIWELEHTEIRLKIKKAFKQEYSGTDKKYKRNVDIINRVTKLLGLNVNPIRINRKDVITVLETIWESRLQLSKHPEFHIFQTFIPVAYDGKITSFNEAYKTIIKVYNPRLRPTASSNRS
jgi:hypothetical protein